MTCELPLLRSRGERRRKDAVVLFCARLRKYLVRRTKYGDLFREEEGCVPRNLRQHVEQAVRPADPYFKDCVADSEKAHISNLHTLSQAGKMTMVC